MSSLTDHSPKDPPMDLVNGERATVVVRQLHLVNRLPEQPSRRIALQNRGLNYLSERRNQDETFMSS